MKGALSRRRVLSGAAALLLGTSALAHAHPYHVTTAVADVRKDRLEVVLQVAPEDLGEALRRHAGRDVDIDTEPDLDALAAAYVRARFVVRHGETKRRLTWVGSEIEATAARLYFEVALPGGAKGHTVFDGMFFDIAPAQVNRVQFRTEKRERTLRFRMGDRARPIPTR